MSSQPRFNNKVWPVTVYRLPKARRLQLREQSWHRRLRAAPHSLFIILADEPLLLRLVYKILFRQGEND